MEQFLGLSRDASREKSEAGTSPYNRNVVIDKQLGSITQENGFVLHKELRGIVVGVHSTNTHIIYITYLTSNGNTLISYVNMDNDELVEVIDTSYFNYSPERPIELVAWYNYNQDLLIMFSDGVFELSSAPRLINLMTIGENLLLSKEFLTSQEAETTLLFTNLNVPRYSISYRDKATHDADVLFFTIAYILPDGTTRTKFISSLVEAFPVYAFKEEYKKAISFTIEDLDPLFNQFVIGIIAYRNNGIFGYITNPISYVDSTYIYRFSGVTGLNPTAPETIVVEATVYEKIKSLTIGNDSIIVGGLVSKSSNKYQKYANNLNLNLYFDYRLNNRHNAPILCPDEVYYFTIALAFSNGTFSEEFHIPGPDGEPTETYTADLSTLGLNDLDYNGIKNYQVINTGRFQNETEGLPNFNVLEEARLLWGYWENQELYPNNDNYNGALADDGITVIPNGRDLRGTPVKLHRVPGLDNLCKKFPMRVGLDIKNEDNITVNDLHSRMPAFSLKVDNFLEAFDSVIQSDNIVGYRLSFVKKDETSKIVEDINFIKPLVQNTQVNIRNAGLSTLNYMPNQIDDYYASTKPMKYYQYGFSKVRSINLSLYKGSRAPQIVKANYGFLNNNRVDNDVTTNKENSVDASYRVFKNDNNTKSTMGQYNQAVLPNPVLFESLNFKVNPSHQKYATIKSINQIPGNVEDEGSLISHESITLKARNSNITFPIEVTPTPDYGWNPLNYLATSLSDVSTTLSLPFYIPSSSSYQNKILTPDTTRRINLCVSFLNVLYNIHSGLQPKEFVIIGSTNLANAAIVFVDFGDTFTNSIYSEIHEIYARTEINTYYYPAISYHQFVFSGMISTNNNSLINYVKDKVLNYWYIPNSNAIDELLTFNYNKETYTKESTKKLNTLIGNVAFNSNKKYISKYPYRIAKTLTIQSENLDTYNVRTFLANAYYDMPTIRGEITYVTGFDKGVYCQQRFSLSIFQLKEKLSNNEENTAYLAETDLFAYKPSPIVDEDNKGYIGSVHQFARKLSKDGLVTIDAERGKVYLIAGSTPKELSKIKMTNFFKSVLSKVLDTKSATLFNPNAPIDNPYNSNGILIGIDDKTNRILVTINNYTPLLELPEGVEFRNGIPYLGDSTDILDIKNSLYTTNNSNTLSFNLDWQRWFSEHDYYPQYYVNTNRKNYAGINMFSNMNIDKSLVYATNVDKAKAGKYFYALNSTIFESYTDLLFNSRYDLSKWYKSVMWRSTVKDINDNNIEEATIDAILLYTDYQCSGRIELDTDVVSLIRNSEGLWSFNSFRDLVKNGSDLPIRKDGSYDVQKVFLNRNWFDKSDIISNFIIVRLIMNNIKDTQTHIHNVNTEARISDRI